jgi:hypothetical protein
MDRRRCRCCPPAWETLFSAGGLRVQRRGWTVRLDTEMLDVRMDYMTRRLHGWYGDALAAAIPDYTRTILAVGLECAALPVWAAEWLPRCERVVAVDVLPLMRYVARRFFMASDDVVHHVHGTLRDYVRRLPPSFDVVLIERSHEVPALLPALAGVVDPRRGRVIVSSDCPGGCCAPAALLAAMSAHCAHVVVRSHPRYGHLLVGVGVNNSSRQ